MKKNVMKGLPKRIAAFMMAVLMTLSLMPIDPSVVLAEEIFYTFEIMDSSDNAITEGVVIEFYSDEFSEEALDSSNYEVLPVDGQDGQYTVTPVEEFDLSTYYYVVRAEGYEASERALFDAVTINMVVLQEEDAPATEVSISGKITFAELGDLVSYEGLTVILCDENGDEISVEENVITAEIDGEGNYTFENVAVDNIYKVKVTHDKNKYAAQYIEVDLNGVTEDKTDVDIALVKNIEIILSVENMEGKDVVGVVYVGGTPKPFLPTVTGAEEGKNYTISYESSNEDYATVDADGKVTAVATDGASETTKVTITATLEGEDYVTTQVTYDVEVKERPERDPEYFYFNNNIIVGDDNHFDYVADGTIDASTTKPEDSTEAVIYAVVNPMDKVVAEIDPVTGLITIKNAGTATVTATLPAEGDYAETTISFVLVVDPAKMDDLTINLAGNWPSNENNVLDFDYEVDATKDFTATPLNMEGVEFTYHVNDSDIASFGTGDSDKGVLTIKKAGQVTVSIVATKDNYESKTFEYTVNINKVDPNFRFDETVENFKNTFVNGEFLFNAYEFVEPTLSADVDLEDAEFTVTYDVEYSLDEIDYDLISVDTDGAVTFNELKKVDGELVITITATLAESENYSDATDSYTITITDWAPESVDELVEIDGTETIENSGWFTSKDGITVSVVENTNYKIFANAPSITDLGEDAVSIELTSVEDGTNNKAEFYIYDVNTGLVSAKCTVDGIKVDTVTPDAFVKYNDATLLDKLLYFFTFGTQGTVKPEFSVETSEEQVQTSDITKYYYIADGATVVVVNDGETIEEAIERVVAGRWQIYDEAIVLDENKANVIYAKVVDEAGNTAYAHTNGLITDNTAPEVAVNEPDTVNGYYKDDFTITVGVVEQDGLSGIKDVYYQIGSEDAQKNYLLQNAVIDSTAVEALDYEADNLPINIEANAYNTTAGVSVYIVAVDNAGNETKIVKTYKICKETPTISVVFDNNDYKNQKNGVYYYDAARTATITIDSRDDVFDASNVVVKVNGQAVNCTWNGKVATIPVTANGTNTLSVEYTNKIGDSAEPFTETFVIDTDAPTGIATLVENDTTANIWDELLSKLTFGIWKKNTATVKATANADTTTVTMQYYVSNSDTILTKDNLDALAAEDWEAYTSGAEIGLDEEDIYAVYFRLVDEVGHVTYLSTDGFIVDMNGSTIAITPTVNPNANGYYNSNVVLNVTAEENISGIKSVEYWIERDGVETKRETLYSFSNNAPALNDLKQTINQQITINALQNNSKNVVVYAKVIDNAGYETTTQHALKINATAPTVDISYDNNNATGHDGGINYFFDAVRTATITITDREDTFNAAAATAAINVVLKDKAGNIVDNGVVISDWESNASGDKHKATVAFTKDGYYTVDVDYTNDAGLSNANVNPAQSTVGALAFVIDTVKPINVSVSALSNTWERLLEAITFGLYTSENVVLTITGEDVTSAVSIEYYIANDGNAMDEDDLALIPDNKWKAYTTPVTITEEQQMAVFVRVTDQAGNRTYVNSDGIVLDKTEAGITLTPEAPNANGVYNDDVDVMISVDDTSITSGIKSVEYWITCDGAETHREILYTFAKNAPAKSDLLQAFNETITVDAEENNSSNVVVYVRVTDNAGNVSTKSVALDIDIVAPTIEVTYDNNTAVEIVDGKGYFAATRKATIVVTERTSHFDKVAFQNAVAITAKDSKGGNVATAIPVVNFVETTEGNTADAATHTFEVVFSADANYTLEINYSDKAGWLCADKDVDYDENSVTPKNFAVDTVAPNGKITAGELGVWESLLQTITFGLWSPSDVDIVITADDATSPVKKVEYYKTTTFTALTEDDLEAVTEWVEGDRLTVATDDIFVVYAKITDQTGHVRYVGTNGIIVDEKKPVFETLSPEISITPERPVNGIYDGNIRVDVSVTDPKAGVNDAYSGLRTIRYEIYNMGVKTQEGTLYNFTESNPTQNKLLQSWNDQDIVVDASRNNSNDVVVKVIATDNAGNYSEKQVSLKIDTTKPVIEVTYDNNSGDTTFADGVYYDANRVATIKVTERNFDASAVKVVITNTDGVIPTVSGWTTINGSGNGDNTVHVATVVYSADGDYTFDISAKDKVGNANNGVNYGDSQAPTAFTIDKTVPVISIAYDNNDYANDNYYKADRTATITINEHNFDASRVVVTITAKDNGQDVTAPAISGWSKSGDTYTATVNYTSDALYTFDIAFNDKAGNAAADFAEQSFYVDKTMPQMSITEIVDQSANNKDKIGFVITATDTNFDVFNPVLTAVIKTETGFTTQELNIASISDIANGRVYTINNIDADGIYRITCTLVDKAGNAYTEVTLHQADGTPYVEERTAEDTLLTFSVNRDGSVFEVDEATKKVLDNYYVYDVKEDVVIIEVNANVLTTNGVTLNGEELVEGTDYSITTEGGNGAWMRYVYTLNKELFVEEGEYTIVVSSVDEAENNAFSDVKNTKVAFVVDRTAPVVTISGLETNGRYQTDAQTVTLIPTDDGGAVKSIVVNQVDADGAVVKVLQEELSGDALDEALSANDGQITFDIPSGEYDYIEVVCADYSVNADGKTNVSEIMIENVLISENELALLWATYQYAIIGGGAAVVAIPTGIVLFRRRIKIK